MSTSSSIAKKQIDEFLISTYDDRISHCSSMFHFRAKVRKSTNEVVDYLYDVNHCKSRKCLCRSCMNYRVGVIKESIRPYFDTADYVSHVVLTLPNIRVMNKSKRLNERARLRRFFRKIRECSDNRYFGFSCIEIKYQLANGDWHLHWHFPDNG